MSVSRFLCRDEAEQRRIADLGRRLRPGTPFVVGVFVVAAVSGVETYGWLPLLPPALGVLLYAAMWRAHPARREHPERAYAGAFLVIEAMLVLSLALGRGPRGYALIVLGMPVILAAVVFPRRVVLAAIAVGACGLLFTVFAVDMPEVRSLPVVVYGSLFVLVALSATALVLRDVDEATRRSAFQDPLTGALNRSALTPRIAELAHQTVRSPEPVGLVVGDVDAFKAINDDFGHASGDGVLREVARRMGGCLDAFEPVYRLGGEEFMVLLPGRDGAAAEEIARRMWQAVREQPIDGIATTMSFGVASSGAEGSFDFDTVFARADQALYAAKRRGRDRIEVATDRVAAQLANLARPPVQDAREGDDRPGRRRRRLGERESGGTRRLRLVSAGGQRRRAPEESSRGNRAGFTGDLEREHLLDLVDRFGPMQATVSVGAFLVIATAIPWFGWYTLVPPVIAAVPLSIVMRSTRRFRDPERALLVGLFTFQTSIAAGFLLARGAPLFALGLLALMVTGPTAVHNTRTAVVFTAYTALLMAVVALGLNPERVLHNPSVLLLPIALAVECGYVGFVVRGSAVDFRGTGVVDELTGLLNRTALAARLMELEAHSARTSSSVAVVLGDLDHFKAVNDAAGHGVGDVVLAEVAARIRECLRSFDSAYRIGGEEFLVLIGQADVDTAMGLAERLRSAVGATPCAGIPVTISLGVAVAPGDGRLDHEALLERADAALYEAKRAGRDRVCLHTAGAGGERREPFGALQATGDAA